VPDPKGIALGLILMASSVACRSPAQETNLGIHEFEVKAIDGSEVFLGNYEGSVLLIVNLASG
jgi:hypothetical protein